MRFFAAGTQLKVVAKTDVRADANRGSKDNSAKADVRTTDRADAKTTDKTSAVKLSGKN